MLHCTKKTKYLKTLKSCKVSIEILVLHQKTLLTWFDTFFKVFQVLAFLSITKVTRGKVLWIKGFLLVVQYVCLSGHQGYQRSALKLGELKRRQKIFIFRVDGWGKVCFPMKGKSENFIIKAWIWVMLKILGGCWHSSAHYASPTRFCLIYRIIW